MSRLKGAGQPWGAPPEVQRRAQRPPPTLHRRAPAAAPLMLLQLIVAVAAAIALGWPVGAAGYTVHVSSRARQQLAEFVRHPPLKGDPVDHMTDAQKSAWAANLGLTAGATLEALSAPEATLTVDVKLVGFDGDGAGALKIDDHELQAQLRTLHATMETVALSPHPRRLVVQPSVDFRVHPAYYKLAPRVSSALSSAIAAAHPTTSFSDFPLALVPTSAVVDVLEEDWRSTMAGISSYTIYLINPQLSGTSGPYAYAYDNEHRSCPGGVYVSRNMRFAFYDIGANVTFYGPGPGGKGQVLPHSVPAVSHYRPESARRAVLPDLAALVWSATRHLVWPPLHSIDQVAYHPHVAVHIIYMHQDLLGAVSHVDRAGLELELGDAVSGFQHVTVHEHWRAFGDCPHCVAGYTGALQVRTSLPHEVKQGGGTVQDVVHYLELQSLEAWVAAWRDVVLSDVGVQPLAAERDGTRVLPVFIFDAAAAETVFIDGWRQAVALASGEVVAVVSGRQTGPTFFGCFHKQLQADPRELQRPVMAAVLQAGWGVADTGLFWSETTGRGWSYLWSLGATPFGPLSSLATLSWAQRDAMGRNVALAAINASVSHAAALVGGFAKLGGADSQVRAFLSPTQAVLYNQRISLLLFKLQEAMSALGRLDHVLAVGYAAAMQYDVVALHSVARAARKGLELDVTCLGARERARWWLLPIASGAVCLGLLAWRALQGRKGGGGRDKTHLY